MRRLFRILFHALTALSLVLALLVAGLWVRSYWWSDEFNATRPSDWYIGGSDSGRLALTRFSSNIGARRSRVWMSSHARAKLPATWYIWTPYLSFCDPLYQGGGVIAGIRKPGLGGSSATGFVIVLPCWLLLLGASAAPLVQLRRYMIAQRDSRVGRCPSCGYDVRATPERCPECGAVPTGVPVQ